MNKVKVWHPLRKQNYEVDKFEIDRLIKMGLIVSCSCGRDTDHANHDGANGPFVDEVYPVRYSYCL